MARRFEDFQWDKNATLLCELRTGDVFRPVYGSVAYLVVARLPENTYIIRRISFRTSRRVVIMERDVRISLHFGHAVYKESKKYEIR